MYLEKKLNLLKNAEVNLSKSKTEDKNRALELVKESINKNRKEILSANKKDMKSGKEAGMNEGLLDRLYLDDSRIDGIIGGIDTVMTLNDPVWKSNEVWTLENGLTISKMTVPLGVVGIIYESRPNVTVDAFALALKSGNCIILRGSSSAINSNIALVSAIKEGLRNSNISDTVIEFIDDTDRIHVEGLLHAKGYIDLIIPRGGKGLIDFVVDNAKVPTLQTGEGNCHIYVDEFADIEKALAIVVNSKTQRVGVCNACETVLVHENVKEEFLTRLYDELKDKVELRGDSRVRDIIEAKEAVESDYENEFLDYILAVKVVSNIEEAINHINKYGTKHSEAIITENYTNSNLFTRIVDASTVYVNAATRFTDGGEFGFGAEMGISTQKIHARGPVGLNQLVTNKYVVLGEGQTRK